jgi:hypothetical protein
MKTTILIIASLFLLSCKKEKETCKLTITYKVVNNQGQTDFHTEEFNTNCEPLEVLSINCIKVGSIQRCNYNSYSYDLK